MASKTFWGMDVSIWILQLVPAFKGLALMGEIHARIATISILLVALRRRHTEQTRCKTRVQVLPGTKASLQSFQKQKQQVQREEKKGQRQSQSLDGLHNSQ